MTEDRNGGEPDATAAQSISVYPRAYGNRDWQVRVPPEDVVEVTALLKAEGVHVGMMAEFSAVDTARTIALVISGGTGTSAALVAAISRAMHVHAHRDDGKKVEINDDGRVTGITGMSLADVHAIFEREDARQKAALERLGISQPDRDATTQDIPTASHATPKSRSGLEDRPGNSG